MFEVKILFSDFSSLKRLQRKARPPFRRERPIKVGRPKTKKMKFELDSQLESNLQNYAP